MLVDIKTIELYARTGRYEINLCVHAGVTRKTKGLSFGDPSRKQCSFGNRRAVDRKLLSLNFVRLKTFNVRVRIFMLSVYILNYSNFMKNKKKVNYLQFVGRFS